MDKRWISYISTQLILVINEIEIYNYLILGRSLLVSFCQCNGKEERVHTIEIMLSTASVEYFQVKLTIPFE